MLYVKFQGKSNLKQMRYMLLISAFKVLDKINFHKVCAKNLNVIQGKTVRSWMVKLRMS